MTTTQILLSLFIINLGTVFGAGLYEIRIVLPLWFNKSVDGNFMVNFDNVKNIDTGRKFWGFVATIPLTLLTIANIVFAFQSQAPIHNWWITASLIVLIERVATFTFFIPTAIKLQQGEKLLAEKISRMVIWWIRLNYFRNAITVTALIISIGVLLLK